MAGAKRQPQKRRRTTKRRPVKGKYGYLLAALMAVLCVLVSAGRDYLPQLGGWLETLGLSDVQQPQAPGAVHFIDVGQGDCALIQSGGKNILIDGGENNQGQRVVAYLQGLSITELDMVVATHAHSDHIAGLDVVMRAIPTKTLLMPKSAPGKTPTTKTYLDMLQAADETGVELVYAAPGQQFSFDEGKIEVLGPTEQYEDANNTSVVLRFTYGQTRFLFTGDAEKKSEKALLGAGTDLRADVLKLGHHGSDTSTSTDFLQAVSPAYAVACVGAGNSYGHPSQQTLDLLGSRGVALYRTDLQGNLLFNTDGQHITVQTQK